MVEPLARRPRLFLRLVVKQRSDQNPSHLRWAVEFRFWPTADVISALECKAAERAVKHRGQLLTLAV
jgi:hypothetical protein